jgi:hypothetical protein
MGLRAWLTGSKTEEGFDVDFDKAVTLPKGAVKVLWHHPAGIGKVKILPGYLHIRPMPRGVTYEEYCAANPTATFGDALILDALIGALLDEKGFFDKKKVARFLGDFSGQIFFLGTAFEAQFEGQSKRQHAFLNWKTYYPATRYICPADHPINHMVNCCACHVEWPAAPSRLH